MNLFKEQTSHGFLKNVFKRRVNRASALADIDFEILDCLADNRETIGVLELLKLESSNVKQTKTLADLCLKLAGKDDESVGTDLHLTDIMSNFCS